MVVSTLTCTVIASDYAFRFASVTGTILPRVLMSSVFNSVTETGSDLMVTYNLNFTMSSLLFAGNTIGYKFYHSALQRLTYSSFALGTLAVQFVILMYLKPTGLGFQKPITKLSLTESANSPSRAKLLVVLLSSIMHAIFFHHDGFKKWILDLFLGICTRSIFQSYSYR